MHSQRHATEAEEADGCGDNVFKSERSCKNFLVWESNGERLFVLVDMAESFVNT